MREPPARPDLRAIGLVLAVTVVFVPSWWWMHPPDPASDLRARARPLQRLERVPAPELGDRFERWRMVAAGDTVLGLWRPARARADWAVVILGGIGTDQRAALLVPDSLPVSVLAVGWPWAGPRRMGRLEFVRRLPAIRAALLRTPAAVARGIAAVRRAEPGARVTLLGASAGVPPTVAALDLVAPDALVLVDGAADLRRLMRSEVARALGDRTLAGALAPPAAALGARLVASLEPSRHRARPGTPVLLVDAGEERRYPPECVARLHATFPGATLATHPGPHMRPEDRPAVRSIVAIVAGWLSGLPPAGPGGGAPLTRSGRPAA